MMWGHEIGAQAISIIALCAAALCVVFAIGAAFAGSMGGVLVSVVAAGGCWWCYRWWARAGRF